MEVDFAWVHAKTTAHHAKSTGGGVSGVGVSLACYTGRPTLTGGKRHIHSTKHEYRGRSKTTENTGIRQGCLESNNQLAAIGMTHPQDGSRQAS